MLTNLIHMTSAYSNAVLIAVLPHVSDFAEKLELPVPLPITTNQVEKSYIFPHKNSFISRVTLTNGYRFTYCSGYVDVFSAPNNFYKTESLDQNSLRPYIGTVNMTTNEAIALAVNGMKKLGYKPEYYGGENPPRDFSGPMKTKEGVIPCCTMMWRGEDFTSTSIEVQIDMQRKTIIGMSMLFSSECEKSNHIGTPLKVDVEPELEIDYRKRTGATMYKRTNSPPPANGGAPLPSAETEKGSVLER